MRYFINFSYHGGAYHGWQKQPNAITVQEVLTEGIQLIIDPDAMLTGAGRTDAGVNAEEMLAHFDTDKVLDDEIVYKLNRWLPNDISVKKIQPVKSQAHARFDAVARSYRYDIVMGADAFLHDRSYILYRRPDVSAMQEAAELLLNYKDFKCFSRSGTDVATYLCDLKESRWVESGSKISYHVTADRFLRNMVRAIVGTLLDIGFEKKTIADLQTILDERDRRNAGASAPAQGLFLTRVEYPSDIFLNEQ